MWALGIRERAWFVRSSIVDEKAAQPLVHEPNLDLLATSIDPAFHAAVFLGDGGMKRTDSRCAKRKETLSRRS